MITGFRRNTALIALLALTLAQTAPVRAADTIKIGFSVSETGTLAAPSIFDRQGYELAADEVNAHGGLLGKKIELVHYDDQSTPSTAVALYQKLITDEQRSSVKSKCHPEPVEGRTLVLHHARNVTGRDPHIALSSSKGESRRSCDAIVSQGVDRLCQVVAIKLRFAGRRRLRSAPQRR